VLSFRTIAKIAFQKLDVTEQSL